MFPYKQEVVYVYSSDVDGFWNIDQTLRTCETASESFGKSFSESNGVLVISSMSECENADSVVTEEYTGAVSLFTLDSENKSRSNGNIIDRNRRQGDQYGEEILLTDSLIFLTSISHNNPNGLEDTEVIYVYGNDLKLAKSIASPRPISSDFFGRSLSFFESKLLATTHEYGHSINLSVQPSLRKDYIYIYDINSLEADPDIIEFNLPEQDRLISSRLRSEDEIVVVFEHISHFTSAKSNIYDNYLGVDIYKSIESKWEKVDSLKYNSFTRRHHFGSSFDFNDDYLIIGCPYNDSNGRIKEKHEGKVYVYKFKS